MISTNHARRWVTAYLLASWLLTIAPAMVAVVIGIRRYAQGQPHWGTFMITAGTAGILLATGIVARLLRRLQLTLPNGHQPRPDHE